MTNPYQAPSSNQAPLSAPVKLNMKQILFSMNGRIPRSTWWMYTILVGIVFNILLTIIMSVFVGADLEATDYSGANATAAPSVIGLILMFLIYIAFCWISICISAKRCHDTDRSGWFQLIPIYGFIITGFFKGTPGPNRFGNNPLGQ